MSAAGEETAFDGHDDFVHVARIGVALDGDTIRARDALAVEQGMDDGIGARSRSAFEPEFGEAREFFGAGQPGVDGQAAGGQAVLIVRTRGAEVGGAEKRQPIGFLVLGHDPKARETRGIRELARRVIGGTVEQRGAIEDFLRRASPGPGGCAQAP